MHKYLALKKDVQILKESKARLSADRGESGLGTPAHASAEPAAARGGRLRPEQKGGDGTRRHQPPSVFNLIS